MALGLSGCGSSTGMESSNLAYLYNPKELSLNPNFVIEHLSDSLSRLHYRINSKELLYIRDQASQKYQAQFYLKYKLAQTTKTESFSADSSKVTFVDTVSQQPTKIITGYLDFKTRQQYLKEGAGILVVELFDFNRKARIKSLQRFSKKSFNQAQYFCLTDTAKNILFKNHLPTGVPFRLRHSLVQPKYYYVSFYQRDFPLALPPYSSKKPNTFELKPDTTYKVPANKKLSFAKPGFYHFRLDTSQWQGYTVYSFYQEFPYVANFKNLGAPLRYLTTSKEFKKIREAKNKTVLKKQVDDFWLARAGSKERAKILIAEYYQRVQEANRLFTSFMEGWKTDRGIIYTIYGPPNVVYYSEAGESWVYGSENSSLSYYFNFERVPNPFTNNDFELRRSPQYRYGWGQAIEAWRNGHIYNSKDIRREQDARDQQIQYQNRNPYWY
jgi:GWxTD domain-containing protein